VEDHFLTSRQGSLQPYLNNVLWPSVKQFCHMPRSVHKRFFISKWLFNWLPVLVNQVKKGQKVGSDACACGEPETLPHILSDCPNEAYVGARKVFSNRRAKILDAASFLPNKCKTLLQEVYQVSKEGIYPEWADELLSSYSDSDCKDCFSYFGGCESVQLLRKGFLPASLAADAPIDNYKDMISFGKNWLFNKYEEAVMIWGQRNHAIHDSAPDATNYSILREKFVDALIFFKSIGKKVPHKDKLVRASSHLMQRWILRHEDCVLDRSIICGLCTDMSRDEHSEIAARLTKSRRDAETQRNHNILRNRKRNRSLLQSRMGKYFNKESVPNPDSLRDLEVHTPHRRVPEWTENQFSHRRSGPSSKKNLAQRARYLAGASARALKDRLTYLDGDPDLSSDSNSAASDADSVADAGDSTASPLQLASEGLDWAPSALHISRSDSEPPSAQTGTNSFSSNFWKSCEQIIDKCHGFPADKAEGSI